MIKVQLAYQLSVLLVVVFKLVIHQFSFYRCWTICYILCEFPKGVFKGELLWFLRIFALQMIKEEFLLKTMVNASL